MAKKLHLKTALLILVAILALAGVGCFYLFRFVAHVVHVYYLESDLVKNCALFIALVALSIAWTNYRRGNTAVVKLMSFEHSAHLAVGVNAGEMYCTLEVRIKNLGLPLRNPSVVLTGFTQFGSTSSPPLKQLRFDEIVPPGVALEKGMVATYVFRSFDLKAHERAMLAAFDHPDVQSLSLSIYSDGFLAKRFKLQRWRPVQWFVTNWNKAAYALNSRLVYQKMHFGKPYTHCPKLMPYFAAHVWQLRHFIQDLKAMPEPPAAPPTPPPSPLFGPRNPGDAPIFGR